MGTMIKICGLRREEDAEIINKYNIDYIGFILAPSKREISPKLAKIILDKINKKVKSVGVFVNMPIDEVNRIADYINLDVVQLHGDETNEDCKKVNRTVWKAISVKDEKTLEILDEFDAVEGFVLDAYSKEARGGTGETFCWDWIKNIKTDKKIILAGGLKSENINKAIEIARPDIVDISSGVETEGYKDDSKIKEIVGKVKG